jgi:uncharacterized membrane protein YhaH (DUF805 family)
MNNSDHPLSVKWLLFSFRGRIGRKSFLLAALFLILVQLALLSFTVSLFGDGNSDDSGNAGAALFGLLLMASWVVMAFSLLALAIKRLHDLSLPAILGVTLLIPGIAFFAWLFLAAAPSRQETNKHGPVPFPRN